MNSLDRFAVAWTIMWGISYIMVALFVPAVSDTPALAYGVFGAVILLCCYLYLSPNKFERDVARCLFFGLGVMEVFGGVASWTGLSRWNVPFMTVEAFQVSMAFADLISAAFMFNLAITKEVI